MPSPARRAGLWLAGRLLHPVLDFLLPTDCFACGEPLDALQRLGACSPCWAALRPMPRPSCPGCGLPRPVATDLQGPARGLCAACLFAPSRVDLVRAAVVYDSVARAFVLRAKLGSRPELLVGLADLLAADLRASGGARDRPILIPVPSHPWADLRRGFAPAAVLAGRVAKRLGLTLGRGILYRRWFPWGTAKRLARDRRRRLAVTAFGVRARRAPDRAVLVDDVMTTGATVAACAEALKKAGTSEVRVAVWARTPAAGDGF